MKTFIKSIIKSIDANLVNWAPYIMVSMVVATALFCWITWINVANTIREDIIIDGFKFKIMAEHLDSSREFMKKNWYSWSDDEKAVMAKRYIWSAAKVERSKHLFEDQPGFDEVMSSEFIHSIKCINTKLNVPLKDQVSFSLWWDSTYIELGEVVVNSNNNFKL